MSEGHPPTQHAKERSSSNSAALLAAPGGASGGASGGCGSERDSGYSDASSDRLQTGVEVRAESGGPGEVPGQTSVLLPGHSPPPHRREATASPVPAGTDASPVFILQNLMLRQDRVSLPGTVKADVRSTLWPGPTGGSGGTGAGQVLLLQQASVDPPRPPLAPPPSKPRTLMGHMSLVGPGSGRRRPSAYPRIAPRPGRTAPTSPAPDPLRGRAAGPEAHGQEPAPAPLSAGQRLPSPSSSCVSSSSSSSTRGRDPRGFQGAGTGPAPGPTDAAARYRRFLHTMRALKRSGLLDLTLRTQELLRRSAASGRAVGQLARHARLLGQLARRPGAGATVAAGPEQGQPAPWERLHQAMARSGGYPSLKLLHQETPSLGSPDLNRSPTPGLNRSPTPGLNRSPTPGLNRSPTPGLNRSPTPGLNRSPTPGLNRSPAGSVPPDSSTG